MQLVVLVLNQVEHLDEILEKFGEAGITGATFCESKGMARELAEHNEFRFLGSLRNILNPARKESKTVFTVVPDEKIAVISGIVNEVTGGLSHPDTGVLFALPVSYTEGLTVAEPSC